MAAKGVSTTADPLDYSDYLQLIDDLERDEKYRWELFCILACALALRASDVLTIKWEDVLFGEIYVLNEHKTGKFRRIHINTTVRRKLFLIYEQMGRPKVESLVFVNERTGRPFTIQNVNYHLRNFKKKYNLPVDRFSSHSFRKTFGMKFFQDQGESERALIILSRELNHSGPHVTRRYIGIKESEYKASYDTITFNIAENEESGKKQK